MSRTRKAPGARCNGPEGMDTSKQESRADVPVSVTWTEDARRAIEALGASGVFTGMDVTLKVGPAPLPNLLGSLLASAHRSGRIRLAGTQLDTTLSGRVVATRQWIGSEHSR